MDLIEVIFFMLIKFVFLLMLIKFVFKSFFKKPMCLIENFKFNLI